MRMIATLSLFALLAFSLSCSQGSRPSAFFQPGGFDADSRLNSLARKLGYMQSKLGFETYEFEFATPSDKKLVATLKAELNGSPVPELSGIYHIPPTGNHPNDRGWISINFFYPQYQTPTQQLPTWELSFSSAGASSTWVMTSPFKPAVAQSRSTSASGLGVLADDQEHKVWEYQISPAISANSEQYEFKYTLTIKLDNVEKGANLQEIRKESLSAR